MIRKQHPQRLLKLFLMITAIAVVFSLFLAVLGQFQTANASEPPLRVTIQAAHNLVVDSNVTSPSTYAPRVATVTGNFCNTTDDPMSNVYGHIGNYAAQTPGEYPATTDWVIDPGRPYAFTHIGGAIGTADATRYVGDLEPGQCKVQYWSFTYPACAHDALGEPVEPPCTTTPTWGSSIKPDDDLSMQFDVWATADGPGGPFAENASWTMTTRNQISAMANKIQPNPDGHWFNTDTSVVAPGSVITTNGVLYSLGNVRFGFDNDGDFIPDYNAWLQPFGDSSYDPSCFRLIRSSTVLTVSRSAGNPDLIIEANDQDIHPTYGGPLFFTNLPPDNTGVRGEVRYTFLALSGPCSLPISPYQEVASGWDNEKFNGDFGTGIPTIQASEPEVTISKSGPDGIGLNTIFTYNIPFANLSNDTAAGLTLNSGGINMPLSVRDTVPEGLEYIGGTAETGNTNPTDCPSNCFTIRFSTDGGATWSATDPGTVLSTAENPVIIEWWLNDPLPAEGSGAVTFQARVPAGYSGLPFIENEACANFGGGTDFACDTDVVMIEGNNSIGDFVWRDLNANGLQDGGAETGIAGITVSLYWDANSNGELDEDALLLATTTTDTNGLYSFTQLPDSDYLVVVDSDDPDLDEGFANTTPAVQAVTGLSDGTDHTLADFGFGPVLSLIKRVVADPGPPAVPSAYEGHPVTYEIELTNNLSGDGTGQGASCSYEFWANGIATGTGSNAWNNPTYAGGQTPSGPVPELNGAFANSQFNQGNQNRIWSTSHNGAVGVGSIAQVEIIAYGYVNVSVGTDDVELALLDGGSVVAGYNQVFSSIEVDSYVNNPGYFTLDVTNANNWEWGGFVGTTNWGVRMWLMKDGSGSTAFFHLDSLGFRITTDQNCGDIEGTIDPLPLIDTFEADKLEFVSASVAPHNVTVDGSNGTISWNNVGPLHAGQTKTITVTFLALEPAGNMATTVTNEAEVTGATFTNGRPVNDADDEVTIGLEPTGSISGGVWNDNGAGGNHSNGVQDGDEAGIAGVTVYLCASSPCDSGNAVATTVTDTSGNYTFAGLLDGNHYTAVDTSTLPPDNTQTGDPDVPGENCFAGVCDNQTTDPVAVSGAANVTGIDYGYTVPNTIFGTIWHDHNGDGDLADATGIPGVTVYLYDNGTLVATTTTDTNGRYLFDNVADGNYRVVVDPTTLSDAAEADVNWAQTFDPDATLDDQHTIPVTIENGNIYGSFDFAYYKGGDYSIAGTVYADWNSNNELDGIEPGFAGITVTLYDEEGNVVAVMTTDANGSYQFDDLPPGTFTVMINENDLPTQYSQTQDPETPGDPCANCNGQGTVAIGNESIADFNFGYEPADYGTTGDFVWHDLNGDGYQNAGEPGLAAITVNLYVDYGSGYQLVDSTETNGSGFYSFTNLPPSDYRIVVDTADSDLPLDTYGSTYVPTTVTAVDVSLASGQTYLDADFGFAPGGVIGNTIYWDANSNADHDWKEPGIPGVTVNLEVRDGNDWVFYAADTTDADGEYLFTGLPAGEYRVVVDTTSAPINDKTLTGDPDTNGIPCDPDPGAPWSGFCDSTHTVNIRPGQTYLGANFGYRPTGVVGDFVWLDLSGNGVRSGGESGLAEVAVSISNGTDTFQSETDLDGYYYFADLDNGEWTLTFAAPPDMSSVASAGSSAVETGSGSVGLSATVTIAGGVVSQIVFTDANNDPQTIDCTDCDFHLDAAFTLAGDYSLSGHAFFDENNDGGNYDVTVDTPLAGMTVYLWQGSTFLGATTTGANGFYQFPNLPNGNYATSISRSAPELQAATITTLNNPPESFLLSTIDGTDVTQQDFGLHYQMDFGDLPAEYGLTLLSEDGARHLIPDDAADRLFLGNSLTAKADGSPVVDANAHASDDGVTRFGDIHWTPGATVQLSVDVTGGDGNGYLVGWFDWQGDGNLEMVILGENLAAGTHLLDLDIPGSYSTGSMVNVRFRLYDGEPAAILPAGLVYNGEVEDYQWYFSPTAVHLQTFIAFIPTTFNPLLAYAFLCLLLLSGLVLWRKRPNLNL
jgi:protocatechuate 3,4-dioxygenase beta subunit